MAEHSFQVPIANSPELSNYLCFGSHFWQESRLTKEIFILTCILTRACAVTMAMGLVKNKAEIMVFVYLKKNPVVRLFSHFAH